MMQTNLIEVFRTSFTLVILLFCSVLSITFAIERWWFFRRITIDVENFIGRIRKMIEEGKHKEAMSLCESTPGPVPALVSVSVSNRAKSKTHVSELMNARRLEERLTMEKNLVILGTLGNTAPFIGLFGTVVGIIKAFRDLALSGSGGPSVVAAGIAEALVATAGGLAVAIPAVILYNYFMRRVKTMSVIMETVQTKMIVYLGLS